ncbi:MAG: HAMP domain-containing histidine kinase [Deltaproteobacteria bacterium]|jgi:signal transduction histidine kinase|nr:HAMP domain-containing histidine kinase [Deltaproteobacteria bacterium]MBT4638111.1 HAMP domain-containing histidine kinase [Deltaproteobacteria bacterium]MBT6500021.1 HAMP domain-containing histidine kinase [Deltaproteobacteria bacterium]MBT6612556.1 HAMP domain-containing histidine kinase [Deltaproteobacteria bacterium]MBT7154768.1 HAMP domain-containing histidine kinase [Deltaproteobacteria bacterium]
MKPGRLYLKIFLSFVVFLIITEIAIFGFFILFSGRYYKEQFQKESLEKLTLSMQLIEREIQSSSPLPLSEITSLRELVEQLGTVFRAKIWLTTAENQVLLKSFPQPLPQRVIEKIKKQGDLIKNERFSRFRNHRKVYFVTPLAGRQLKLHILFPNQLPDHGGFGFAVGLLSIGLIAALLVIPVSRQISRPVKSLTRSAAIIAQGELSHRAAITTKDEIGELGKAFNHMAKKVESMVNSGKELTAQISHELRSPLARIQLAVEIVKDQLQSGDHPEIEDHLVEIQEDIGELDHLIGRILALSKLDLQETNYSSDLFSPVADLETCLEKYGPMLENKTIRVQTQFNVRPEIHGNREAFRTVIANIVDNAVKYSLEGKQITFRSELQAESLLLKIANASPPISSADLSRIFEPFFRVEPDNKNGVGLGLAITRKIVEKHQGTISARATAEGLEVEIRMPLA